MTKLNKVSSVVLSVFFCCAAISGPALGQETVEEINAAFHEWMGSASEFVGGVTFNENDVLSFIRHWEELNELDQEEDDGELLDFEAILNHPEYRAWASDRGLDPEDWMRKSVRITLVLTGEQIQKEVAQAKAQVNSELPEQLKMLESQRAQLGEEAYQQMKQAVESSAAMVNSFQNLAADWPKPTASEKVVLDKHRAELLALIEADDEDEEPW
jgi:hypothetical protein